MVVQQKCRREDLVDEDVKRYRALSPADRMRVIRCLLNAGELMFKILPKEAEIRERMLEEKRLERQAIKEFIARHSGAGRQSALKRALKSNEDEALEQRPNLDSRRDPAAGRHPARRCVRNRTPGSRGLSPATRANAPERGLGRTSARVSG
jgi:hypothetical protein